jgi:TRAP-type C4-dicarboxylate transport system substrate-binding protein
MSSAHITINEKSYAALPADQQKLLSDCAKEAVVATRKLGQQDTDETIKKMTAEGASVSTIDKAPIQQKAKDAVIKMEKDGVWSNGLWEQIQKL